MSMSRDEKRQMQKMQAELDDLRRLTTRLPTRSGGGGGSARAFRIQTFVLFPPIPSVPTIISCKGQAWYAEDTYSVWYPMVKPTSDTGVVGT